MNLSDSKKVLIFPVHSTTQPSLSIHPQLWAETIRPTDIHDLRLDKIAALRDSLASGAYQVSAAALAENLLQYIRTNA